MAFTVELGVEAYRIVGPHGEEGEETSYNSVATLKIGSKIYYCDVEFDPTGTFALPEQVVACITESITETTTTTDVLFEGESEDDRGGEEDVPEEDDDGEEEFEPGPTLVE